MNSVSLNSLGNGAMVRLLFGDNAAGSPINVTRDYWNRAESWLNSEILNGLITEPGEYTVVTLPSLQGESAYIRHFTVSLTEPKLVISKVH